MPRAQRILVLVHVQGHLPDYFKRAVIFLMVDTHNKHWGISTRGRDDDPLGTTLQVRLQKNKASLRVKCCISQMWLQNVIVALNNLTEAFSMVVKTPVDSTTYWAPASPHLMLAGSLLHGTSIGGGECVKFSMNRTNTIFKKHCAYSLETVMAWPSMTSLPPSAFTSPLYFPWVESYLNMYTWTGTIMH